MSHDFKTIKLDQIADVIHQKFKSKEQITCYLGSNAASPTASMEALTEAIRNRRPKLPFMKMVHILMQGPVPYVEEGLQDRVMTYSIFSADQVRDAANKGRAYYLPCSLANVDSLIGKGRRYEPDVVIFKVSQNPMTGEFSLGLSVEAIHTAIDHAELVIAELDNSMPFTVGQSIIDAHSIDFLIEDERIKPVYVLPAPDFDNLSPKERRIGELITRHFIRDGITLQVGIGKIPDAVVGTIRDANYNDLGIQTELYGDGLMYLQKLGVVTNRRKRQNMRYSTTSLIMGSQELYDFVNMRASVQMRTCAFTNSAETIRQNSPFISINTAMGVDLYGNVWADFIDARHYYSGVGGQPDFVRALNDPEYGTPIIALMSTTHRGESKIVPAHPKGVSLTASAYDGVVIANEYGIADLRGLTSGEKALAVASIAHPKFRDNFLKQIVDDPLFTKPMGYSVGKIPHGVTMYDGNIKIDEE
ncbi:acetyl-CoA hydrolase/transferase family protein [candidate division KSB1 bacterium]|nr:acetyl-CoA hydrolase/transferase family protein [candidate division KSB1 bacterium]